jgi:Protein-tyrosine-phosphatase
MKICFVCHGNICRSPMAEYMLKDILEKKNIKNHEVVSRATSYEEIGNDIYPGTKKILNKYHIPYSKHKATKLLKEDYDNYDYFIGMDEANIRNMKFIFEGENQNKIIKLLDLTGDSKDVADPWYTGDFEKTYRDIKEGLDALLKFLEHRVK